MKKLKLGPPEPYNPRNLEHKDPTKYKITEYEKTGRRPESIKIVMDLKSDVERRDITINAMAIDKDGNIIDYFDGKKDIKNKIIKAVGNPYDRFEEDLLRIARIARFSSKFKFSIDKQTGKAAKKLSKDISKLPYERIKDELFKAASYGGDKFATYIETLDKIGVLRIILPELINLKYIKQPLHHHPEGGPDRSVWNHVMAALRSTNTTDPIKNLAILLHDTGKLSTLSFKDGMETYHGHAEAGIEIVEKIADRLKLSNKERDAILFAVAKHMKFHGLLNMKPSKIFKLVDNDNWDVLTAVAKADEYARGGTFKYSGEFEKILDKAIEIKNKWGKKKAEHAIKLVDGRRVMELTGLRPGPKVGKIIKDVTEWIINHNIDPNDDKTIENKIMELTR